MRKRFHEVLQFYRAKGIEASLEHTDGYIREGVTAGWGKLLRGPRCYLMMLSDDAIVGTKG